MNYTPNFSDVRIQRAAKRAIAFVEQYARVGQRTAIARTQLYKHFGNTSRPLGSYLLNKLLIVVDPYFNFNTHVCKKYIANVDGIAEIKQLLGITRAPAQVATELVEQLTTGAIEYHTSSDRLYNPLQYIPRQQRSQILNEHGYRYHYDIEAAAPCLLVQRAQAINPNLKLEHLSTYIANRQLIRSEIARACNISIEQAKIVINAILQGAVITSWSESKLFKQLDYSYQAVQALKTCEQVINIKSDIRDMWSVLRDLFPDEYTTTTTGISKRVRVSAKAKSQLYRELENQVGRVIRKLLKKQRVRVLWVHDGWYCDEIVDPNLIASEVRKQTGYCIQLDWTRYEDT